MKGLRVFLFGVPRFEYQNQVIAIPRRKSVALVSYLALNKQPQSRETLAALLWPDLDEKGAHTALRSTLYSLTALFPNETLFHQGNKTFLLNDDTVWIDVRAFRELLAEARLHAHRPDHICAECIKLFLEAAALYQEDFLSGFMLSDSAEYDDWQSFQREALRREMGGILRQLAEYYGGQECQEYEKAIGFAQRWLKLDVLVEAAHRLLMRLYAANSQRSEAIRQYHECTTILNRELITPPEEATTALYEEIRKTTTATLKSADLPVTSTSILPPLPALIIGRERALADLKKRLGSDHSIDRQKRIVIQGWPGVGKSTLMAALTHDAEIHEAFPDGVLWTSLGEEPNLTAELLTWAKSFRIVNSETSYQIGELTSLLTAAMRDKRMLLVVDDVWKVEHASPFKVGGQNCALVLSTRLNDLADALAPTKGDIYRLTILNEDSGLELLSLLAPDAVAGFPREARALVQALQGLPLGIQVAGRLLTHEMKFGWGLGDLLYELQEGARLLKEQVPGDMVGPWQATTPTIAALLRRSTDALDDLTRQRFADLGLFVPKPATFDLQAMAALWQVDDPKPTARILVNRGLLEPLSAGRFQMHTLLVLHARSMDSEG